MGKKKKRKAATTNKKTTTPKKRDRLMSEIAHEYSDADCVEIGKLAARWLPASMLEGLRAVADHPLVRTAAKTVKETEGPAWHCQQVATTAAQEAERLGAALAEKQAELDTMQTEIEQLTDQLRAMPLDDGAAEKLSGRCLHAQILAARLEQERNDLREREAAARQHAEEARGEADAASARLEIARLGVRKALNQAVFPTIVDWALSVAEDQARLVQAARALREQFHFAEDPGMARLLPRADQPRSRAWEALERFITRPGVGFGITPSAPRDAFSIVGGNGDEPPTPDEQVEADAAFARIEAEEAEADAEGWVEVALQEGGGADA